MFNLIRKEQSGKKEKSGIKSGKEKIKLFARSLIIYLEPQRGIPEKL